MFTIPLIILAVVVIFVFSFYNRLKTMQVRIRASIQEIGNQLKLQASVIPNLITMVGNYTKHEKGIYEDLTSARKSIEQANQSSRAEDIKSSQEMVSKALGSLRIVVESNPELKAAPLFSEAMAKIENAAEDVSYARRTLIDLTADYNTAISTIPGIWLAPTFNFKPEKGLDTPNSGEHLTVSDQELKTPQVKPN